MCRHLALLLTLFATLIMPTVLSEQCGADETGGHYQDWKHSGSMWILTTSDGAALAPDISVASFPMLVRLHGDFFDFREAKAGGADLRFATSTGEPLAYQIEDWDAVKGVASIWVRIPKITGNSRQELKLHWGNEKATSESDGKAVFNESNGYLSVWHMHDVVQDDVGSLTSTDTGTTATVGMIGVARHLANGKGVFCGDMIPNYPIGSSPHSTEAWFRVAEARFPKSAEWTVRWPTAQKGFRDVEFSDVTRNILKYTDARSAVWADEQNRRWAMVLIRWAPGRTSVQLARSHGPEVCLPAGGAVMTADLGLRPMRINGVDLPIHAYTFRAGEQVLHVFYCLWEQRPDASRLQSTAEELNISSRLEAVRKGVRNAGQQAIEVVVSDIARPEQAEAEVRRFLEKSIQP